MRRTVDGVTLGYDLEGSGEPLLFLHGFPLHRGMWRPQVAGLRDRFQVLTVDLRGFGESSVSDQVTLAQLAADVRALAASLGIARATVIGLSMGGYVAFRLLEQAPTFATRLVLADTRAEPDTEEGRARRLALAARVAQEGCEALRDFVGGLVGPTTRARRPHVVATVEALAATADPRALAATLRALAARPDSRPLLSQITVPTLVLVGEEDSVTPPEVARAMAAAIPNSRLIVLPEAGHLSNLETPEAFTTALHAFLEATQAEQ
ncbi:MAG: alpha/beta fold hydrolase [Armatimonadota bacterium]|nr:alpha/beta fold hydrolase [Armatimonadota bacterium]MDR7448014.1 alpha/beta fold hydrolase [Armatimonadota bacterium]MDR7459731.1 alpha/beta fold hydrolase [Armatimonadota bacterium]MDR7478610.1 alpha/beta fold hydrolase [Armatimonadota bacterium]MDR7488412.1 alpha/beta fold hydrolase [Armatimonadota bacterium]